MALPLCLQRIIMILLGVTKNTTATDTKKADYGLAKKIHPDTNEEDPEVEKKFQEVSKAYEVLKDDEKRRMYDRVGHEAFVHQDTNGGPGYEGGFGNPFKDFINMENILNMKDFFRNRMSGQDFKLIEACVVVQSNRTLVPKT